MACTATASVTDAPLAIARPLATRIFLDHRERGGRRGAIAVERAAQVVHHHPGATHCQRQRMLAAQAAARTGDQGHAAIESHRHLFRFP